MNLIFDYDGTIHNSMKTYAPSFRSTMDWLAQNGFAEPKIYTDNEISYWLGFNSNDMWQNFMPDLDPKIREEARIRLGNDMAHRVENGEGALFDGAEKMLSELKRKGYFLIFLSNCRTSYLERHRKFFALDRFFDSFYCCEEFGFIPKYEIFRKIAHKHSGGYIVIGDRFHDIETAVKNNLPSVGCSYGYGSPEELSAADIIVRSPIEIVSAVNILSRENRISGKG